MLDLHSYLFRQAQSRHVNDFVIGSQTLLLYTIMLVAILYTTFVQIEKSIPQSFLCSGSFLSMPELIEDHSRETIGKGDLSGYANE